MTKEKLESFCCCYRLNQDSNNLNKLSCYPRRYLLQSKFKTSHPSLNTVQVQPTLVHSSIILHANHRHGFSHKKHLQRLSILNMRLSSIKQDYYTLTYFHAVSKLTFLLTLIQKKLIFMNFRLESVIDDVKLQVEQSKQSKSEVGILTSLLLEQLKECISYVEQFLSTLDNFKENSAYKKYHKKLVKNLIHMQPLYHSINSHFRFLMQNLYFFQSFSEYSVLNNVLIQQSFNQIIGICNTLFQSIHEVSYHMKYFSIKMDEENCLLNNGCNIESSQRMMECVMHVITESAKWRSLVVMNKMYQVVTKGILGISGYHLKGDEIMGLEKSVESIQKYYFQFVSNEESFFSFIWEQIISVKEVASLLQENLSTHLLRRNASNKVDCFKNTGDLEDNSGFMQGSQFVKDFYMNHLWDTININLKLFFIDFNFDACVDYFMWNMLRPDVYSNYIDMLENSGKFISLQL